MHWQVMQEPLNADISMFKWESSRLDSLADRCRGSRIVNVCHGRFDFVFEVLIVLH